ncbi:MAG: VIT domain-containing protein [Anaerolineales bacterium]
MKKFLIASMSSILLLLFVFTPVFADGIIIPDPPICPPEGCSPIIPRPLSQVSIKYHHVKVQIDRQIATTNVDQVFYNPNEYSVEGMYVFPLPADAVVSKFMLWVDGEPITGKVLDATEAREYYERVVQQSRDPALLEYIGRGAVQARIFPIPPRGERRIALEYQQVLTAENGLVRYIYPLNTEKFSAMPLESVTISVEIKSDLPVRAVYSSNHTVSINRESDKLVRASYEANQVRPDTDFILYYSVGENEAFHLFSFRDPKDVTDSDGFFMILLAPSTDGNRQVVGKDILLVLDRSGSMEGEKFSQAKTALRYILSHLNEEDRFYLLAFSSGVEAYSKGLRPASESKQAISWVDRLSAGGSTDINRALLETLSVVNPERPAYLIFLTDGLPTEGVTDSEKIIANVARSIPENVRLFTFGVGYDVDTFLLDTLAQENHGLSTYVKPEESMDEILSGFYGRISDPVLTDLDINFGNLSTYDVYPMPLPDLFAGSQVVIVGRYRSGGVTDISVKGMVNGELRLFRYAGQAFATDSRGIGEAMTMLPRLWATRKIGYLLRKIRLDGPDKETIDQIIKLSIRYGIITPYTSYLVTEPKPLGAEMQDQISRQTYEQLQMMPPASPSGQAAVEKAAEQGTMTQAEVPLPVPEQAGQMVRTIGSKTFVYQNGIWVDTGYDPQIMKPRPIPFLSTDYFAFAQSRSEVAAALSLGERVIVVIDGVAYQIIEPDAQVEKVELPEAIQQTTVPSVVQEVQQSAVPSLTIVPTGSPQGASDGSSGSSSVPVLCMGSILSIGMVVLAVCVRVKC